VANGKILQPEKFALFLFESRKNFFFKFILSCQQSDNRSHCLPPVSTTLAKLVAKFAAGVVDIGGEP
jgi:hypothetical protein